MKKSPILWLLAAGIIALIAFRFFSGDTASGERPPSPVIALKVYTLELADQVQALGTAKANESIEITANATETIEEILFTDGQQVKKGDVLVRLDQQEEEAQLEAAKAQLVEHERELKRLQTLLKNKAASKREYDERITLAEVTRQRIKEIEARISNRTLAAPFDGVLGVRRLSVGALVQPGDLITTLDQIDPIKLDFNVPEIYLSQLKPGLEITALSDALPDHAFKGIVETVNSRIDPVTHAVLLRAMIANEEGLIKPGLLLKITLLEDRREAVIVPEESIIQRQEKHYITVVKEDNTAEERAIEIGTRRPGIVEVKGGLEAGEIIVVRGMGTVRDGQPVTVQEVWETIRNEQYKGGESATTAEGT